MRLKFTKKYEWRSFPWRLDLGASQTEGGGTTFKVWAPKASGLSVRILTDTADRVVRLMAEGEGYFAATVAGVRDGASYFYRFDDGTERPDPASRFQPEGVHGPSRIVDPDSFPWTDDGWKGMPLDALVIYELHTGTFSREGTFEAIIPRLDYLSDLGVTAVELMPVGQFPGERNWGYDGVYPFAPQNSYGGPRSLKRLVDACHNRGLAVIFDVVYNHQGPEGNYGGCFGHYRTDRYRTPWGDAVNYDGPDSDQVRHFVISNALYWITEYHADALRLDAVHGIFDFSARHILEELGTAVHSTARGLGRTVHLIAESDLNDVRLLKSRRRGGYGLDAQWNDDFHHSLHALLTNERQGYFGDFGRVGQLSKAIVEGFVYDGCYSAYRRRRHGSPSGRMEASQFVICAQNHDQVGNRMYGERLSSLVSFESLKLAAGLVFLSPGVPLLFMGEEYGETAPFLYFIDHGDPALSEAVCSGRRRWFAANGQMGEPPDPAAPGTFARSRLDWTLTDRGDHRILLSLYRTLIALRKGSPALATLDRRSLAVRADERQRLLIMERWSAAERLLCLFSFAKQETRFSFPGTGSDWCKLLDSAAPCWRGPGSLLPEAAGGGEEVAMGGASLAVFRKGGGP